MRILQIGNVECSIKKTLESNRVSIEIAQDEGMEDLIDWVKGGNYDAIMVNVGVRWNAHLTERLRTEGVHTPVVAIAQEEEATADDRAEFLELGGDDLLSQPVSSRELLASLRAVVRRFKGSVKDRRVFVRGGSTTEFDCATGKLRVNGKEVKLTFRETKLVELLCVTSPRVQSKERIQECLYPYGEEPGIGSVEVFLTKIRKKMRIIHSDTSELIETVWNGGYRMAESE